MLDKPKRSKAAKENIEDVDQDQKPVRERGNRQKPKDHNSQTFDSGWVILQSAWCSWQGNNNVYSGNNNVCSGNEGQPGFVSFELGIGYDRVNVVLLTYFVCLTCLAKYFW